MDIAPNVLSSVNIYLATSLDLFGISVSSGGSIKNRVPERKTAALKPNGPNSVSIFWSLYLIE